MDELSTEDLQKGIAAFLMCFGMSLPQAAKDQIRRDTYALAEEIAAGGEPTVARLAKGFADQLAGVHLRPSSH